MPYEYFEGIRVHSVYYDALMQVELFEGRMLEATTFLANGFSASPEFYPAKIRILNRGVKNLKALLEKMKKASDIRSEEKEECLQSIQEYIAGTSSNVRYLEEQFKSLGHL